ncbi:MAG: transposase [Moheibacter sp.]
MRNLFSFELSEKWGTYSYCGIAPFEYSSGSSIRGRTRVNHLADKKMKSLLHLLCLTAIRHDEELKLYYLRKKEEGKHSLLVLNSVKCKLVSRIFAVIKRDTPFVKTHQYYS